jgi:hypothetical protein
MFMKDWMDYLGKLGESPERSLDVSWRPPVGQSQRVEFTNAIRSDGLELTPSYDSMRCRLFQL